MSSLPPLQLALLIVAVMGGIGVTIVVLRDRRTYSGYETLRNDAKAVAAVMRGEIFRDADDLVISGNYGVLPAVVRFSNSDNTPGVDISVQAPATFSLTVMPASAPAGEGRVVGRTGDAAFDTRFTIRSSQPAEARMFLSPQVIGLLKRLCCSTSTQISVVSGAVELSEMVIPAPQTAHHVTEHLKQISGLATTMRGMPGADKVKIVPFKRERNIAARVAMAVGAVAALIVVFTATSGPGKAPNSPNADIVQTGIMPIDAPAIRDAQKWHVAAANDFDGVTAAWLRDNGVAADSHVTGDFSGRAQPGDSAYFLQAADGKSRVVLISQGAARYDGEFASLGGIGLLPKENVSRVEWLSGAPDGVDGDGLVIVRKGSDTASAFVVFLRAGRPVIASPANYQHIALR